METPRGPVSLAARVPRAVAQRPSCRRRLEIGRSEGFPASAQISRRLRSVKAVQVQV